MSDRNVVAAAAHALLADYFQVARGSEVLITADTGTDGRVAAAILEAAGRLGARCAVLTIPTLPFQGALANPYIPDTVPAAARAASVWIDLTFPYLAGAHAQDRATREAGLRYLLMGDLDIDGFGRMYGRVDLDRYFEIQAEFDALFGSSVGAVCRIADRNGTDVAFKVGTTSLKKPRRAEASGMYLVPGSLSIPPDIETVKGTIAIGSVFHEFYESLRDPILVEVEGKIRAVRGGGGSAMVFERALKRAAGSTMGSIIHFTQGFHPAARFTGKSFIEDSRVIGNNAVGFGIPWWEPGGGENHPDGVAINQSVWLENQQVIADGRFVWPASLASKAETFLSSPR